MAQTMSITFFLVHIACISISAFGVFVDDRKVYIVYMGALPEKEYSPSAHHQSVLQQVLEETVPSESLVRSYGKSFNGFAARLTDRERQKLVGIGGIVSIFPSEKIQLHTSRSWDFIGFPETVKRIPGVESDVVVGVIDTGITPDSESFTDEGFGPPPKKWKGVCNGGHNFTCNNKLIGARFYSSESAIDNQGHGTHTTSTGAGNQVRNASFYGLGSGNVRGAVPSARVAAYRACSEELGCPEVDVMAAFDDAISDGVDIISISLGRDRPQELINDIIAIGAFHAMQKGILTVHSAGNSGPSLSTTVSVAPWVLSVAASTIDRGFLDKVILGDGTTFVGSAVNGFDLKGKKFPLIYGGDAASSPCDPSDAGKCAENCLDSNLVKGKIVFCESSSKPKEPFAKKAVGAIILQYNASARVHPLPTSAVNVSDGEKILSYIKSTKYPMASISKSEDSKDYSAPLVASFSSRGPNVILSEILKPDVTAPGVNILAGWSPLSSPSSVEGDARSTRYNIISGTSMACPHVTGAAAYVKSFHPDWSPSAIKSALMTTASPFTATDNPDREFSYGAGHIVPVDAINPGLVYEANEGDYIYLLCTRYNEGMVTTIVGKETSCPRYSRGSATELNYPTMASNNKTATFKRTVTNVGLPNSTYTAKITSPPDLEVTVSPKILSFKSLKEKKSFFVTVSSKEEPVRLLSASLVWSDGVHTVRSPIVVHPSNLYV